MTARLAIAPPKVKPSAALRPKKTSNTPRPSNAEDASRLKSVIPYAAYLTRKLLFGNGSVYYRSHLTALAWRPVHAAEGISPTITAAPAAQLEWRWSLPLPPLPAAFSPWSSSP